MDTSNKITTWAKNKLFKEQSKVCKHILYINTFITYICDSGPIEHGVIIISANVNSILNQKNHNYTLEGSIYDPK